jgi:hypothetical protein
VYVAEPILSEECFLKLNTPAVEKQEEEISGSHGGE